MVKAIEIIVPDAYQKVREAASNPVDGLTNTLNKQAEKKDQQLLDKISNDVHLLQRSSR